MSRMECFCRQVRSGFRYQLLVLASGFPISACGPDKVTAPLDNLSPEALEARAVAMSLTTVVVSATQITLYWNDTEPHEAGWQVFESTGGAFGTFALVTELPANTVATPLTGKTPGSQYCYKVRAFTKKGRTLAYSVFSNVACATTPTLPPPPPPPAAPSALTARAVDAANCCRGVTLTWTDNSPDDNRFIIEQAGATGGPWSFLTETTSPDWRTFWLPEEQQLCYRVMARRDTVRSQPSNVDCTAMPRAPSGLAAVGTSSGIDVSWTDNSAFEHGYAVARFAGLWPSYSEEVVIATLPPNAVTYRDASALTDTKYWYRVWALRDGARVSVSNEAAAVIATAPPIAPTNLNATPSNSSAVYVYGEHAALNTTGFRLERSADGVSGWITAVSDIQSGITDYGVQSEQRVCYRMFAFNGAGESPPSNVDCTTPPAAPSDIAVVALGDGTSRITWRDNSIVEDGYVLTFSRWTCNPDTGECYDEWFDVVLGPNTTEHVAAELFIGMAATSDGGWSDWVQFTAGGAAGANLSTRLGVPKEARMVRATTSRAAPCVAFSGRLSQSPLRACSSPQTPVKSPNRR